MPPICILLVDDSPEFLESAAGYLATQPDLRVVGRALSGPAALEQAAVLRPDLVLMDIALPGMNGLEAARQIKAWPAPPRIIILTLHDNPEYRSAAAAVRADGFVAKSDFGVQLLPVVRALFATRPEPVEGPVAGQRAEAFRQAQGAETFRQAQGAETFRQAQGAEAFRQAQGAETFRQAQGAEAFRQAQGAEPPMKHILIVDDSQTMRRMIMASLRGLAGATFDEASSGLEAIERLALAPVNLMTLDLNMPDMHGLEVLQFVRRHQAYRTIPIVVITTKGEGASRSAVMAAGATRYVTKPFSPPMLAALVNELLQV
jgi:two-component system chemotaxis response regulator CheY